MRRSGFLVGLIWAGAACAYPLVCFAQQSKGSAEGAEGKRDDGAGSGAPSAASEKEAVKQPGAQQGTKPGADAGPKPGTQTEEQVPSQGELPAAPQRGSQPGQQSAAGDVQQSAAEAAVPEAEAPAGEGTGEQAGSAMPPGADAAGSPPPGPAPAPAPASGAEAGGCVPECRAGYSCYSGQCVSVCNPPCAPNEACTAGGTCRARAGLSGPELHWEAPKRAAKVHSDLFVRFTFGPVWGLAMRDTGEDVQADGLGLTGTLDIGGAVVENFILHARISGRTIYEPMVQIDGGDRDRATEDHFAFRLLGGGLTVYFMPINLYGTLVLGFTWGDNDIEAMEQPVKYETGFGLEADFGKEWWMGDEWGLGVAARLAYNNLPPQSSAESDNHFHGLGVALLVSATFN